jgi:hypothetical protein
MTHILKLETAEASKLTVEDLLDTSIEVLHGYIRGTDISPSLP